jgi:hypothetical protein
MVDRLGNWLRGGLQVFGILLLAESGPSYCQIVSLPADDIIGLD